MTNILKNGMVFLLIILFAGCNSKIDTDEEITKVLYKNISAAENENLEQYMNTIDTDSPIYDKTKNIVIKLFTTYELKYDLKKVVVLNKSSDEARVGFIQKTTKLNGPAFRNNEISGVHILKKIDGKWKIYNTETNDIKYL